VKENCTQVCIALFYDVFITICISFHARRINMHVSFNGKEHMHISIRLDCIRCFMCTKLDCA
jgi:hypothetical protein